MKLFRVMMAVDVSVRLYADLHLTDENYHLFYTFENGLVFSCPLTSLVEEI